MSRRMRWSTMGDGGLRSARHINDVCSSDLLWHRVWAEVRRSDVSGCDVDRRWAACHGVCAGAQWATAVCDRQDISTTCALPIYFGIEFGQRFAGATFLAATLTGAGPHVTAYALEHNGRRRFAIVNKDDSPVRVELPSPIGANAMRLSGPGLDSKEGTVFGGVRVARSRDVAMPGHTAMIYEI